MSTSKTALVFSDFFLLVPKIEIWLELFFDKNSQKQPQCAKLPVLILYFASQSLYYYIAQLHSSLRRNSYLMTAARYYSFWWSTMIKICLSLSKNQVILFLPPRPLDYQPNSFMYLTFYQISKFRPHKHFYWPIEVSNDILVRCQDEKRRTVFWTKLGCLDHGAVAAAALLVCEPQPQSSLTTYSLYHCTVVVFL